MITLLTDFGTDDGYVAQMKGVMLGIAPEVTIVDVTHAVPPQDVRRAALILDEVVEAFPPGTVHVVVVDPGVGSARALVGAEAADQRFLAPDNGVLSCVFARHPPRRIHRLTAERFRRTPVSSTFHGRDLFAPAAASLSRGTDLSEFGPSLAATDLVNLAIPRPRRAGRTWIGEVIAVDRFGNLITNLTAAELAEGAAQPVAARVTIGTATIEGVSRFYAERGPGELLGLIGSSGRLEVAVNGGSAAQRLGLGVGAAVQVDRAEVR
jgi:S-adenosylmethionine hydrolase